MDPNKDRDQAEHIADIASTAEPSNPDAKTDTAPAAAAGPVDIEAILAKVQIEPQFKKMYDAAVLSGVRIMFDKRSHPEVMKHLEGPGAMADKIAGGIVGLMYMLWNQSNKTMAPQIIVPVTFTLTLKGFDFLQKSGDPEATKEVLGEAVEKATGGIMKKFGVAPEQIQQVIAEQKARAAGGQAPTQPDPNATKALIDEGT